MSFFYGNIAYPFFFNFVANNGIVSQGTSSVFNPDNDIYCYSSNIFGNIFNEDIKEIYGKFSFYINSLNPGYRILRLLFYDSESVTTTFVNNVLRTNLPNPICNLECYPSGSSLTSNNGIPFKFFIGDNSIYTSSSEEECANFSTCNFVWFHITCSQNDAPSVFEIRLNNNSVHSYSYISDLTNLGNMICFELNNYTMLSNIIFSTSELLPNEKIYAVTKSIKSNSATYNENSYKFVESGQYVRFGMSYDKTISNTVNARISKFVCGINPTYESPVDFLKTIRMRDTSSNNSNTVNIPSVGDNVFATISLDDSVGNLSNHTIEIVANS